VDFDWAMGKKFPAELNGRLRLPVHSALDIDECGQGKDGFHALSLNGIGKRMSNFPSPITLRLSKDSALGSTHAPTPVLQTCDPRKH
jgi:hypothetical protein